MDGGQFALVAIKARDNSIQLSSRFKVVEIEGMSRLIRQESEEREFVIGRCLRKASDAFSRQKNERLCRKNSPTKKNHKNTKDHPCVSRAP